MEIKIKLPSTCQHLDLSDAEKVIANLMLNIAYIESRFVEGKEAKRQWMKTEYYFYNSDLGRIMNTQKLCGNSPLNEAFRIGLLNEFTIAIMFKKPIAKFGGTPDFYHDTIKDIKSIKNHAYLMGRFSYPEGIVSKEDAKMLADHPIKTNAYATIHI